MMMVMMLKTRVVPEPDPFLYALADLETTNFARFKHR